MCRCGCFSFIYTSFELSDYAYDVVCDRLPLEVLESTKGPWRHSMCIEGRCGVGCGIQVNLFFQFPQSLGLPTFL